MRSGIGDGAVIEGGVVAALDGHDPGAEEAGVGAAAGTGESLLHSPLVWAALLNNLSPPIDVAAVDVPAVHAVETTAGSGGGLAAEVGTVAHRVTKTAQAVTRTVPAVTKTGLAVIRTDPAVTKTGREARMTGLAAAAASGMMSGRVAAAEGERTAQRVSSVFSFSLKHPSKERPILEITYHAL